jgi:hypothetical protein
VISTDLPHQFRSWFRIAWPGLALAAVLIVTTSLGGCASFDPSRISINVDPDQFTSISW